MSDSFILVYVVLFLAVVVAARVLTGRLMRTKNRKARFAIVSVLFLIYTIGLFLILYNVYDEMLGKDFVLEEYHQMVVLAIIAYNTAVFFMGCMTYALNGKHKLSDEEKMKLQDM